MLGKKWLDPESGWWLVTSGVAQGSVLETALFNIAFNNLDKGIKCSLIRFANDTMLGGTLICGRAGGIWTGWVDGSRPVV